MKFSDLVLLAENRYDEDGDIFVSAVVQWISDNADFDEEDYDTFRPVGDILFNLAKDDLVSNKSDYGEYDKDPPEYFEVIVHLSNIFTPLRVDLVNNTAFSNWAYGDKEIANRAWERKVQRRKALKDNEHGMDLTF